MHTSFTVRVPIFLSSSKSSGCTHTPTQLACQRHVDGVRSSPVMDTLGGRLTRYLRNIALPSTSSTVQQTRRRNLAGRSASTPRLLTPDTRLPHPPLLVRVGLHPPHGGPACAARTTSIAARVANIRWRPD